MFIKQIKLFNLLGFPIYVDLSWLIIAVLISWSLATDFFPGYFEGLPRVTYWIMGVAGALGLFASILAHELGHAVVARQYGVQMRRITLFIFGGVAEMSQEPPSAKAEFFVAIAGPIVSVLISAGCYIFGYVGGDRLPLPVAAVLWYLWIINGVVVIFNMIPAFPLDGGRVLRSALWHLKGNLRWATRITSDIGSMFGLFLVVIGVVGMIGGNFVGGMWQVLISMFLRNAAQMSYQNVLVRRSLEGETLQRFMRTNVVTVDPTLPVDRLVEDYMYRFHHKMFPVTDNGRLLGCVTTRDVQRVPREEWSQRTVGDIVEPCHNDNTIRSDEDVLSALASMSRTGASRLMVVEDGRLVGILSLKDLLDFISLKVELDE